MSDRRIEDIDEQLVAYLDGELEPADVSHVEQQLRVDPDYQRRLQELERAWDMLDDLPRPQVAEDFTRSTVAMVAMTAARQAETTTFRVAKSSRVWWSAAAGVFAAGLLGFVGVYAAATYPNRKLLRDLPVIEHVDDYRYVESVEFLELLEKEGLFDNTEVESDSI